MKSCVSVVYICIYIHTHIHTYNAWMNKVPVEKIIHRDVGKVVKREKKKREREREKKEKERNNGGEEGEKEKMTNPGL